MQCQLIRLAVAQYGFAAARRHALETYGPEAVKTGDKCFTNVGLRLRARTKRRGEYPTSELRAVVLNPFAIAFCIVAVLFFITFWFWQ
jgi:hypothetical protein